MGQKTVTEIGPLQQRDAASAEATVNTVAQKLDSQLPKVANKLRDECHEALSYLAFPQEHWRQISSTPFPPDCSMTPAPTW